MVKLISINIDNHLIDKHNFEQIFYYEEIPKLITEKHKISLDKAKQIATNEYKKVSVLDPNFYRPQFWFDKFKLTPTPKWEDITKDMTHQVNIHREAPDSFQRLRKLAPVVIITKHPKEFIRAKLHASGLRGEYSNIFSAVDDQNIAKVDERLFAQMLKVYGFPAEEVFHIGDNEELDHKLPQKVGIPSAVVDREGVKKGKHVVPSLKQAEMKMMESRLIAQEKQEKKPKMVYFPKKSLFEF